MAKIITPQTVQNLNSRLTKDIHNDVLNIISSIKDEIDKVASSMSRAYIIYNIPDVVDFNTDASQYNIRVLKVSELVETLEEEGWEVFLNSQANKIKVKWTSPLDEEAIAHGIQVIKEHINDLEFKDNN